MKSEIRGQGNMHTETGPDVPQQRLGGPATGDQHWRCEGKAPLAYRTWPRVR